MARDKAHKPSSETQKVLRDGKNEGKNSSMTNGGTSETPELERKRSQKTTKQAHLSDGEKDILQQLI